MRIREAWCKIVVAPVIAGLIAGCVILGATAPKPIIVDRPIPNAFNCMTMLLKSSACEEDTVGWIGSSQDDRFKAVKA